MARSSPKFGSVTTIPSICSRCFLNSSAQRAASWRVSTAPNLDSLSSRIIGLIPLAVSAEIMSRRPERARWSGKNPRFPTMTPSTIGVFSGCVMVPLRAFSANACMPHTTAPFASLSSVLCTPFPPFFSPLRGSLRQFISKGASVTNWNAASRITSVGVILQRT